VCARKCVTTVTLNYFPGSTESQSTMAMICICGICIPYTSLLPILIVIFQPLWKYLQKLMGWDKKVSTEKEASVAVKESCCSKRTAYFAEKNSIKFTEEMDWGDLIVAEELIVCKFTATWCKPCKRMEPVFEELTEQHKNLRFVTFDVDEHDELFQSFGIIGIPHINVYKNGEVIDSLKGEDHTALREFIGKYNSIK
jgi:thioredoxin 1